MNIRRIDVVFDAITTAVDPDAGEPICSHADGTERQEMEGVGDGVEGEERGDGAYHRTGDRRKVEVGHIARLWSKRRIRNPEDAYEVHDEEEEGGGEAPV